MFGLFNIQKSMCMITQKCLHFMEDWNITAIMTRSISIIPLPDVQATPISNKFSWSQWCLSH